MGAGGGRNRQGAARWVAVLLFVAVLAQGLASAEVTENAGTDVPAGPVVSEPGDAPMVAGQRCGLKPSRADRSRIQRMRSSPRVLASTAEIMRVRRLSRRNADAAAGRKRLISAADRMVGAEPWPYRRVGPRVQFFGYKNRILTLALAWRLEGDPRYVRQAQREMVNVARYPSWNPAHFLDTAEITAATALGYDWLREELSAGSRRIIRRAIVSKGLRPSLCSYRYGSGPVTQTSNWGIVTNSGMAIGAVAVADTHPRLAAGILGQALRRVRPAMARYRRDGSYPEGLGYWRYATEHAVKLQATMRAAFSRDFGLGSISGFRRTGNYALRAVGPTGKVANFGNAEEELGNAAHLYWLARRFGRPVDAWLAHQLEADTWSPLHLLWVTPTQRAPAQSRFAASAVATPLQTAFLRGGWSSANTGFVAVKGGSNAATHAQPELGAFVYDVRGHRWATDLGLDNYNLPGYFDPKRARSYYRLSSQGQNTLTIGGRTQPHRAVGRVTLFRRRPGRTAAVLNLSSAYPVAQRVRRGVALLRGDSLLVQDEVAAPKRVQVRWAMHTTAVIDVADNGRSAVLRLGEEEVIARILRPTGARFSVASAEQAPPQAPNVGVHRLQVRATTAPKPSRRALSRLRTVVLLAPVKRQGLRPDVRPLRQW